MSTLPVVTVTRDSYRRPQQPNKEEIVTSLIFLNTFYFLNGISSVFSSRKWKFPPKKKKDSAIVMRNKIKIGPIIQNREHRRSCTLLTRSETLQSAGFDHSKVKMSPI